MPACPDSSLFFREPIIYQWSRERTLVLQSQGGMMKKFLMSTLVAVLVLVASANTGRAEVKSIQMKIAGYLCGN